MTILEMAVLIYYRMKKVQDQANKNMYQVTVDYAKVNLDELCDRAGEESEGVAIVRKNRSYILITHEEWESLIETAELVKAPNLLELNDSLQNSVF